MIQWRKIQEDTIEGFRLIRGEAEAFLKSTLVGTERARIRRALSKVDEVLQQRYQEVGEKIYQRFMAGGEVLIERDFQKQFEAIERLQAERQRVLEELKATGGLQD